MLLQYASDLHLEFPENRAWLKAHPIVPKAEVLLMAGDVLPLHQAYGAPGLFKRLTQGFREVIWLPGNHEYYGGRIVDKDLDTDIRLFQNIRIVNNRAVHYPGLRILCTTLWTAIAQMNEGALRHNMNDYHAIRHGRSLLMPAHTTRFHAHCLAWLKSELAKPFDGCTIVATHHVPSLQHYPPEYVGSALNQAFAVELDGLIAGSGAAAWIYGHHHRNTPAFTIGDTRMLTNQLGYVAAGEHRDFHPEAVLDTGP